MSDDYESYDFDYYDAPELTDAERITMYVEDDIDIEQDTHWMLARQNERWQEFRDRQLRSYKQTLKDLKASKKRETALGPSPVWWELWLPIGESRLSIGDIAIDYEREVDDINLWSGDVYRSILRSERTFLDLHPHDTWAHPGATIRHGQAMFPGPDWAYNPTQNCYWDAKNRRFRTHINRCFVSHDEQHNLQSFRICTRNPPPWGHWMPYITDFEHGGM